MVLTYHVQTVEYCTQLTNIRLGLVLYNSYGIQIVVQLSQIFDYVSQGTSFNQILVRV